jgi:hypothetical protein
MSLLKDSSSCQVVACIMNAFLQFHRGTLLKTLPFIAIVGIGAQKLLRYLQDYRRRQKDKRSWDSHVDMNQIQACLLSTEHLQELGRIEKRTLFVKDIDSFFGGNTCAVEKILQASSKTSKGDYIVTKFLPNEDKWHILNICTNQISSLFAPYHVFFNEARRCKSYYKSAWYCFTLTCTRTEASGRYFITPFRPVLDSDFGALRIRIVLVNEQELRDISAGIIKAPAWGFFNERHKERWDVLKSFSLLFEAQLRKVAGVENIVDHDWGANLCGRIGARKIANPSIQAQVATEKGLHAVISPEDNCFLRIHIPFPGSQSENQETRSKDVVLFE